jgi:hypothetical protein
LQAGCQRWNDAEFNPKKPKKPLETKVKIYPAFARLAADNFRKGYVQVGTKQGSYADVSFEAVPIRNE